MSHDVDFEFERVDVTLSFTLPGEYVYVFAYEKGGKTRAPMAMLTLEEWGRLHACVRENLIE
jgi:hypothetical protein